MKGLLADSIHAFRIYRRTPFASLITVGVLAVGLACVTAFLSLYVDLVLRQHPPPPDPEACFVDGPKRGRPPKSDELKPIAPYDNDPARAVPNVFDRITGELIPSDRLKTYAEALSQYLDCN